MIDTDHLRRACEGDGRDIVPVRRGYLRDLLDELDAARTRLTGKRRGSKSGGTAGSGTPDAHA